MKWIKETRLPRRHPGSSVSPGYDYAGSRFPQTIAGSRSLQNAWLYGLGANPDGLRAGDVLLHVHRFTVVPDAPPGRYWIQVGLYNPDTMHRLPLAGIESDRLLLAQVEVTER